MIDAESMIARQFIIHLMIILIQLSWLIIKDGFWGSNISPSPSVAESVSSSRSSWISLLFLIAGGSSSSEESDVSPGPWTF